MKSLHLWGWSGYWEQEFEPAFSVGWAVLRFLHASSHLGHAAATPWASDEMDRPLGLGAWRASGHIGTHHVISSAVGCGDADALVHHFPNLCAQVSCLDCWFLGGLNQKGWDQVLDNVLPSPTSYTVSTLALNLLNVKKDLSLGIVIRHHHTSSSLLVNAGGLPRQQPLFC